MLAGIHLARLWSLLCNLSRFYPIYNAGSFHFGVFYFFFYKKKVNGSHYETVKQYDRVGTSLRSGTLKAGTTRIYRKAVPNQQNITS